MGIKQALYRTSGDSPIVASLIRASERGEQVAALVELKARFDEAANIEWAKALEDSGVHVVYGVVGLKTHCKITLVLRSEGGTTVRYVHIGTGNYNDRTARIYEDFGLLTRDPAISHDVGELFNFLTGFSRIGAYEKLIVSPLSTRTRVVELINAQRDRGPEGRHRDQSQWTHRSHDYRCALRRQHRWRGDSTNCSHPLFAASRRREALREHHRALGRGGVLGALSHLHLWPSRR